MPILREYAEEFLSTRRYRGRPLAPRTTDLYRWVLKRHVLPYLGERELSTLTPPEVRRWNARLSGPDGPGSNTAAKAYRLLASICATAVADGLLTGSPCTVRGGGQHSSEPRPTLTVTDVLALADAVPVRWRAIILTAAWTGLRFGELAALRRPNLDLDRAQVRVVVATGTLLGGQRVHGKPKTRAGRRTVALPAVLLPELQRHLDGYAQPASDGLIFTGIRGAMLRRSDFCRRVWLPAAAATGLDGAHFHDLRHVAGTLAAQSGASVSEVMARLGHSSPRAALRYVHATSDRDVHVAAALSAAITAATPLGEGK
jgi:integrase